MNGFYIGNDFLAHKPIPGVRFEHNDYVHVVAGNHKGESGSLVSLHTLADDPSYVLEAESGRDLIVLQSHLQRVVA
jgi:hypothetical protein